MLQTVTLDDIRYHVELTADYAGVILFTDGLFDSLIGEIKTLHDIAPVSEVFFRPNTPGLFKLTVSLVDGRKATYVFYDALLAHYTLNIDGGTPWAETETLKLPGIRNAMTMWHNTRDTTSLKVTVK